MATVNTCAFDCIFSHYACLYQDYSKFRAVIDNQKTSQLCTFIANTLKQKKGKSAKKIAKNVPKKIYTDRKLLYKVAGISGKIKQLTTLDCETGFAGVFSQICKQNEVFASSILKRICDDCEFASRLVRPLLPVSVLDMDIRDLQNYIVDPTTQDEFCPECKKSCIAEHRFNPVLALEVKPISKQAERKTKVMDITSRITVNDKVFHLCGVVEAQPRHFICHVLRSNDV